LIDIETLPNLGWTWSRWETNVIAFQQETCIATFAAKWLGEPVFAKALPDYKGYKPGSYDDRKIMEDLHALLDEADVVVAHNGNSFDVKVINARFLFHQMPPPSPYKTVDTKLAVKRVARFNSNKLDDLGKLLLGEGKIKTDFELWLGCIKGDPKAWAKMVRYNKADTVLLERLYLRLLPWISNHPNLTLFDKDAKCPKCGSKNFQRRGYAVSATRRYQRVQCTDCGGWSKLSKSIGATEVSN
jgi:predicted nucleic-acid-binding Zn-ribbon protein